LEKLIPKVLLVYLHAKLVMVVCVHPTLIVFQTFAVVPNVVVPKVNRKDARVVLMTVVVVYVVPVITILGLVW